MTSTEKTFRKLGANRNEPAQKPRRTRSRLESCDVREDRGARQSKFAQPGRSVVTPLATPAQITAVAQRVSATHPLLLSEHTSGPKSKPSHLRFLRDGARNVFVAGTFNDWEPQRLALQPDNEGGWEIDLFLPPGDYEYRFFVNGEWADDPLACRVTPNPYGGVNAVLHVHGG